MDDTDKSGLIDDALNLARGGYLSYDVALEITKFLDKEDAYLPWKSAIEGLEYIDKMLMGSPTWSVRKVYNAYKFVVILYVWRDIKWCMQGIKC